MFPNFLPQQVYLLEDKESISLAQSIKRHRILTNFSHSLNRLQDLTEIATANVLWGNATPPILLLHGFDSSLLEFRRLIPLLSVKNETWAVDLLGFGFTERLPNLAYNPDTIRKHLYYFWQTLIKRPVILVGASMGGATAIDFTLNHSEAVSKLVLINSVGYGGSFPIGQLLPEPIIELGVEFWRLRRNLSLFWGKSLNLLDATLEDVIRCAALPSFMPNWDQTIKDFTRSGGYYFLEERITRVKKPTLILWGEQDPVLGTETANQFHKDIAGSRLVWLSEAGHSPQWEQPELVAGQIQKFILCR